MVLNCDMTLNTKFPVGGPPQNGPHQVPKIGAKTQEIMRFSQTWGGPFGKV